MKKLLTTKKKKASKGPSKGDSTPNISRRVPEAKNSNSHERNHKEYWEMFRRLNDHQWKVFKEGGLVKLAGPTSTYFPSMEEARLVAAQHKLV